jgi:hypothetical protein
MLALCAILAVPVLQYFLAAGVVHNRLQYAPIKEANGALEPLLRNYLNSCLPLVPCPWIGFTYPFAKRRLLQGYRDCAQQAYDALDVQFAGIPVIATSSTHRKCHVPN